MHLSVRCPCLLVHHEAAVAAAVARVQCSAGQAMPRLAKRNRSLVVPCPLSVQASTCSAAVLQVAGECRGGAGGAGRVQERGGGCRGVSVWFAVANG